MIYLVDDDTDDSEIVQEALSLYSYKGPVTTATNGEMLMRRLHDERSTVPDVIVLDLNMPLKDGFAALHEIKTNPAFKSIPVIILTASSNKADEKRCFEFGCNYFFTKPSKLGDYRRMTAVIKMLIENKAA